MLYNVLVYEGWGKTYLIEAESMEAAEAMYEEGRHGEPDKEDLNETFVVEVTE